MFSDLSPSELISLATVVALWITCNCSSDEICALKCFFNHVMCTLSSYSSQDLLIKDKLKF